MNKNNLKIKVTAKVLPENATLKEIIWKPVLKECVSSDYISVNDPESKSEEDGVEIKKIQAESDGECILRCTAHNGTEYDEVLSDLPFIVSGLGTKNLDPYNLIEAIRFTGWDRSKDKPQISL
jgi:beta-galactosidase